MKQVKLIRAQGDEVQTLGVLVTRRDNELWTCKTLELPWKNNAPNISCIPTGTYLCRWTLSCRLRKWTYEVMGVPKRAGIRIHPANLFHQLHGCIALGDAHKDINADGHLDLIHSGLTVEAFNNLMGCEDFELVISNAEEN